MVDKSIFHAVFADMERKAKEIEPKDDDYIKDGVLYCGICNEPRQEWKHLSMGDILVKRSCECERTKARAEREAEEKRLRENHIYELRSKAFADKSMQYWSFDTDDRANPKLSEVAHRYVDKFTSMNGKGLLLYGGVGTGKTYMTACIANALIDKEISCYVTSFARIVNTVSGLYEGKQEYIDGLNRFKLLVIDDLASERDTEYMGEIVQNVIDTRYSARLPLIVTTNLTGDGLKYPSDIRRQRIYSRLFDMCIPFEVKGKDRRKEHLKDNVDYYKDLLGI